ncbi:uncharacterized protein LOC111895267 isoform X1 [Lactuca sativa]|uniref:Uncharacterized protein n=1 Tax=Lactuca sativa TaxID=4236 RepID=A0A9R1WV33_LACSA|nr:uncharacterized protein LOC111895267 isoform X1 [Lactuca sativa]XP_023747125.1 uncharacterized protein LOC111895267 isoform X1 [Lactuca sativa]XP_042753972.1 uncharacterized protein LOC111895267 isoform X1 [Lactuca sativa]KAJ0188691.1 hypothetical protein LSAT_V11C900484360 [Lactuca sativa]
MEDIHPPWLRSLLQSSRTLIPSSHIHETTTYEAHGSAIQSDFEEYIEKMGSPIFPKKPQKLSNKDSSQAQGTKGPRFEDGPNFDIAFRLFHGQNGVVPLSEGSLQFPQKVKAERVSNPIDPITAKVASVNLSDFRGLYSLDSLKEMIENNRRRRKSSKEDSLQAWGIKDPEFEDDPNFVFHGLNGVVPLSEGSLQFPQKLKVESMSHQFNPLAAKAAKISLSGFGGSFGFDAFGEMFKNQQKKHKSNKKDSSEDWGTKGRAIVTSPRIDKAFSFSNEPVSHQLNNNFSWFDSGFGAFKEMGFNKPKKSNKKDCSKNGDLNMGGNCPSTSSYLGSYFEDPFDIAPTDSQFSSSMYTPWHYGDMWHSNGARTRSCSNTIPIVAKPSNNKNKCMPAIWGATTALANNFLPQSMLPRMMVMSAIGMATNVPLGMWRQHTPTFSPSWFIATLATIPFLIPMFCASDFMPKPIIMFTLGASVLLGQVIGSLAQQYRLRVIPIAATPPTVTQDLVVARSNGAEVSPFHIEVSITLWRYRVVFYVSSQKISLCVSCKHTSPETLTQTTSANNLAPQPMLKQIFLAGAMAMAAKIPLGMLHGFKNFHFLAKLCNWVLMQPQTTMALTFGGSILGMIVRSMAEQYRLEPTAATPPPSPETEASVDGGGSDQAEEMAFHIKVVISLWSYLISLDSSPLESSFLVSQQLALPSSSE